MQKYLKYVFGLLSIGLTLISMRAGFSFYHSLFGLTMAVLATSVFEALRLALLYATVSWGHNKRVLTVPFYAAVALICSFAAVASLYSSIIESYNADMAQYRHETERRTSLIKKTYAQKASERLDGIENEIDRAQRNIAAKPWSTYWPKRVEQLSQKRQRLVTERDTFLSSMPQQDAEVWIGYHAAELGMELEPITVEKGGSSAISQAIRELWGVTELKAKKIVAIILTIGVEVGILLLAIFAGYSAGSTSPEGSTDGDHRLHKLIERLHSDFDGGMIRKFVQKARPYYLETGRLPKSSSVSKNLRPIRSIVAQEGLGDKEMKLLFDIGEKTEAYQEIN